MKSRAT